MIEMTVAITIRPAMWKFNWIMSRRNERFVSASVIRVKGREISTRCSNHH